MPNKQKYLCLFIAILTLLMGLYGAFYVNEKFKENKRIVTVNVKEIVVRIAKDKRYQNLSKEEFEKKSESYLRVANALLKDLSETQNLIIMAKPAIIAGAEDITEQVMHLLEYREELLEKEEKRD